MENTFDYVEKTIVEKDENGNDVEIVVKEYPNIPVVVENIDNQEKEVYNEILTL